MSQPRIFFLHIPRTGGMSISQIIQENYEPEEIYTLPSVAWNDQNYASLRDEWTQEQRDRIKVVNGHIWYGFHKAFGDDSYEYITMLRDPVARVQSLYNYVLKDPNHYLYHAACHDLETFLRLTGNGQTHQLVEIPHPVGGYVGRAMDRLVLGFTIVGFTERFEESVHQMQRALGWKVDQIPHLNHIEPISSVLDTDLIRRYNELDVDLYEQARKVFWT